MKLGQRGLDSQRFVIQTTWMTTIGHLGPKNQFFQTPNSSLITLLNSSCQNSRFGIFICIIMTPNEKVEVVRSL